MTVKIGLNYKYISEIGVTAVIFRTTLSKQSNKTNAASPTSYFMVPNSVYAE